MGTVGLSNWGTVAITDTGKVWQEMSGFGERQNQESCLGNVKFEMPIRHPNGDIKLGDGYMSPQQDNSGLEMKDQSTVYLQHIDGI